MATITLSLPDTMKEWLEGETQAGGYAGLDDFMQDLVRRERARRERPMTREELRKRLDDSRASGVGVRSIEEILAEGDRIARARGMQLD